MCDKYGFMVIDEADIEAHGPFMIYRKEDTDYNRFKRWNEMIADDPAWEEVIVDRVKLMVERDKNRFCIVMWSMGNESAYGCNFEKHWNGQRILIQTASHNMRVQDTVIMMKHMITAIWMCTAGCIRRFPKFRNIWIKMEANPSFW